MIVTIFDIAEKRPAIDQKAQKPPTDLQLVILTCLGDESMTGTQLMARIYDIGKEVVNSPIFYTNLFRMEKRGWIEKSDRLESDQRSKLFTATQEGKEAAALGRELFRKKEQFKKKFF